MREHLYVALHLLKNDSSLHRSDTVQSCMRELEAALAAVDADSKNQSESGETAAAAAPSSVEKPAGDGGSQQTPSPAAAAELAGADKITLALAASLEKLEEICQLLDEANGHHQAVKDEVAELNARAAGNV